MVNFRDALLNGNGIARRLTFATILFSSFVTIGTTFVQLYLDYRHEVDAIYGRFAEIRDTVVPSLANSVWVLDSAQIELQVAGLLRLPDIEEVVVRTGEGRIYAAGKASSARTLTETDSLVYRDGNVDRNIGTIEIVASIDVILVRIWDKLIVVLATNAAKTMLVVVFMLLLFQYLVTQYLYRIAEYMEGFAADTSPPIVLNRRKSKRRPDAFDRLVESINAMRSHLIGTTAELRRSELDYRGIFDNAPIGIFRIGPDGRFSRANPALTALLGYPSPEELAADVRDISRQVFVDQTQWQEVQAAAQSSGTAFDGEVRWRRRDGRALWVQLRLRTVQGKRGDAPHFEGAVHDISSRKAAEAALIAAKEAAEAASRAKSSFLANMSHELRTPLNAVIGFAEMLSLKPLGPGAEAKYRTYSAHIVEAGQLLLRLINDILDLSRIEAEALQIDNGTVVLDELVRSCLALVEPAAHTARVAVTARDESGGLRMKADSMRIQQILLNLLSNAIKFTAAGGHVEVRTWLEDKSVNLSVTDSGIGMRPDQIPFALQEFSQLEDTYRRKYGGTGLGLPLARKLTELHGGRLSIESQPGIGTTVTVSFPPERTLLKEP